MQFQNILLPVTVVLLAVAGFRAYGLPGLALVGGGLVMWLLLHFTRTMQVLRRAAERPVGHVDSAVMLNARLRAGQTLLHIVAITRSLGSQQSEKDAQSEVFRWTDAGGSHVTCTFTQGKLTRWELVRPEPV